MTSSPPSIRRRCRRWRPRREKSRPAEARADRKPMPDKSLIIAASGATGALYTQRLLRAMEAHAGVGRIYFTATKTATAIAADELGVQGDGPLSARLLGRVSPKLTEFNEGDLWAPIASGTVHTDGMVIAPCSAGTLGSIA